MTDVARAIFRTLVVSCLVVSGAASTNAQVACCPDSMPASILAPELLARIAREGLTDPAMDLWYYHHDSWMEFLKHVGAGEEEWLKVAVAFAQGVEAGPHEGIMAALGEALASNPASTLAAINERGLDLSKICETPVRLCFETHELALAELARRFSAVKRVNAPELTRIRDEVLWRLSEEIREHRGELGVLVPEVDLARGKRVPLRVTEVKPLESGVAYRLVSKGPEPTERRDDVAAQSGYRFYVEGTGRQKRLLMEEVGVDVSGTARTIRLSRLNNTYLRCFVRARDNTARVVGWNDRNTAILQVGAKELAVVAGQDGQFRAILLRHPPQPAQPR